MRRSIVFMLVAMWMAAGWAQAQDPRPGAKPDNNPQQAIEFRQKQLELQAREAELDYQRNLRNLDLEQKRMEIEQKQKAMQEPMPPPPGMGPKCPMMRRGHHGPLIHLFAMAMFVCGLIHILLAVWVCQDLRKRNTGSGIWIVVSLLAGIPGTLLYLLSRIGDPKTT